MSVVQAFGGLERPEPEEHRRERLSGFVMQLAGKPLAFELLGRDHALQRVSLNAARKVDGDGGPLAEPFRDTHVLIREAQVTLAALDLVVRADHADRLIVEDERRE